MKMFYSWSGKKSHKIALSFSEWIPCLLNAVKPWVSSEDIDRGSIWLNDILEQLKDTNYGLVFVTKENQNKPWILFESGALSKGLNESRVYTVLIDLQVRDIDSSSPLKHLNHTTLDEEGVLKLLKSINKNLEHRLDDSILEMSFKALWPVLFEKISQVQKEEPTPNIPQRDDKNVLNDILDNVLNINKKIGRGELGRQSRYIDHGHATSLFKRLNDMELDDSSIRTVMSDLTPRHWLEQRLRRRAKQEDIELEDLDIEL